MGPNRRSRVERLARNVRSRTTLPFVEGTRNGRSWPDPVGEPPEALIAGFRG